MKNTISFLLFSVFLVSGFGFTGCSVYSFSEKSTKMDPNIKTVNVHIIENRAQYINPQLSPNLTDRLKQKITRQTKLTQINDDDKANLIVVPVINNYSVTTSGISSANGQTQTSINRLTVGVHVAITNTIKNDTKEFDVSHSFDFSANQSLNQAEANLLDEMVRNLSDEIFNRIFSDW